MPAIENSIKIAVKPQFSIQISSFHKIPSIIITPIKVIDL